MVTEPSYHDHAINSTDSLTEPLDQEQLHLEDLSYASRSIDLPIATVKENVSEAPLPAYRDDHTIR